MIRNRLRAVCLLVNVAVIAIGLATGHLNAVGIGAVALVITCCAIRAARRYSRKV